MFLSTIVSYWYSQVVLVGFPWFCGISQLVEDWTSPCLADKVKFCQWRLVRLQINLFELLICDQVISRLVNVLMWCDVQAAYHPGQKCMSVESKLNLLEEQKQSAPRDQSKKANLELRRKEEELLSIAALQVLPLQALSEWQGLKCVETLQSLVERLSN